MEKISINFYVNFHDFQLMPYNAPNVQHIREYLCSPDEWRYLAIPEFICTPEHGMVVHCRSKLNRYR